MGLLEYNRSMQQSNNQKKPHPFSSPFQSFLAMSAIAPMSHFCMKKGSVQVPTPWNWKWVLLSLNICLCQISPAVYSHSIKKSFTFSPYLYYPEYLTASLVTLPLQTLHWPWTPLRFNIKLYKLPLLVIQCENCPRLITSLPSSFS